MSGDRISIRAALAGDLPEVRAMVREYVDWIGLDLAFQEIDPEIDGLPGEYAPPRGALLVAAGPDRRLGLVGLRPWDGTICEMKRLYVRPEARGRGLARRLILALVDEARRLGYTRMHLDTLPMMHDAQALYAAIGFTDIAPYYDTPIAGTRFMSRKL